MSQNFLLLGDFHFLGKRSDQTIFGKIKPIVAAVKSSLQPNQKRIIIVINGDIASTGKQNEYKAANAFIHELIHNIKQNTEIMEVDLIFSPGNHDCDFEVYTDDERSALYNDKTNISQIQKDSDQYNKKLGAYLDFISKFRVLGQVTNELYYSSILFTDEVCHYEVVSYNSVLAYDYSYHNNGLMIDSQFVLDNLSRRNNRVRIALTHFPLEYYNRNNPENYRAITNNIDFLFTSHEHEMGSETIQGRDFTYSHISIPALNPTKQAAKCGFVFLCIDVKNNRYEKKEFIYVDDIFTLVNNTECEIKKTQRYISPDFVFDSEKMKTLFGNMYFDKSIYNRHDWSECFVKPTLVKQINEPNAITSHEFIEYDDFDINSTSSLVVFVGDQFIGKTTILKSFIIRYMEQGWIPIYIDIARNNTIDRITKDISTFILDYYKDSRDYIQQNSEKILLLIDNIHTLKSRTAEIMNSLKAIYKKIFASVDSKKLEISTFDDINETIDFYDIMSFGNNQKYQLVEKWIKQKSVVNDYQYNQKINEIMEIIMRVDRERNFMTTPTLVMIFLQAYDDHQTDHLMNGSKGVYYQYMINKHVIRISEASNLDTNFVETYLIEYAYWTFTHPNTDSDEQFDNHFIEAYPITKDEYYHNRRCLRKESLCSEVFHCDSSQELYFTNEMIYAYFIARYYEEHKIKRSELKNLVKDMSQDLSGNILLFYLFLTKDEEIISEIEAYAYSLFGRDSEIRLEDDITFINDIIAGVNDVKDYQNIKEKNQKLNKMIDQNDYYKKIHEKQNIEKDNPIIAERKAALQTAEIVTEILNLFPNKVVFTKMILSTTKLTMRKASAFLMYIYAYVMKIARRGENYYKENMENIHSFTNRLLVTLVYIFVDLADELKNPKYKSIIFDILDSIGKSTAVDAVKFILDLYFQRHLDEPDYDCVLRFHKQMITQKNMFAIGMVHIILDREINYIDMKTSEKNRLLTSINASKLNMKSSDPVKNLQNTKDIRTEKLKIIHKVGKNL